jgi:hypothetical protein
MVESSRVALQLGDSTCSRYHLDFKGAIRVIAVRATNFAGRENYTLHMDIAVGLNRIVSDESLPPKAWPRIAKCEDHPGAPSILN